MVLKEIHMGLAPWMAAQVRSRSEFSVSSLLGDRGYESYLPTYRSERQWSDRTVVRELPLVPGYVFVREISGKVCGPVVTTPGVLGLVAFGHQPALIDDSEIQRLKTVSVSALKVEPLTYLKPDSLVRIKHGPLVGTWGTVVQVRKKTLLVLSIEMLNRSVAVHIDPSWVEDVTSFSKPSLIC
jgi:transcriptional antiterminator RfaH